MSALESFLLTITNPTIAYILLSMGSLGLLLELLVRRHARGGARAVAPPLVY